jgi:hypothetical protein
MTGKEKERALFTYHATRDAIEWEQALSTRN